MLAMANSEVLDWIMQGHVMKQPEICPDEIYSIMKKCWALKPEGRPDFTEISQEINNLYVKLSGYSTAPMKLLESQNDDPNKLYHNV